MLTDYFFTIISELAYLNPKIKFSQETNLSPENYKKVVSKFYLALDEKLSKVGIKSVILAKINAGLGKVGGEEDKNSSPFLDKVEAKKLSEHFLAVSRYTATLVSGGFRIIQKNQASRKILSEKRAAADLLAASSLSFETPSNTEDFLNKLLEDFDLILHGSKPYCLREAVKNLFDAFGII